jgi:hypothetical protein
MRVANSVQLWLAPVVGSPDVAYASITAICSSGDHYFPFCFLLAVAPVVVFAADTGVAGVMR